MDKAAKAVGTLFIVVPGLGAVLAAMIVWRGYVLSILWAWFVVPAFALPVLSVPMAIGVSMVASGFTETKRYNEMTDPEKRWQSLVFPFLSPVLALGLGWIVKQYV